MKPVAILVVDDNKSMLEGLKSVLHLQGYDVSTAENALEALNQAKQMRFDVVLTDLRMPAVDGFQIIEQLRALNPDVGIILFSGSAQYRDLIQAIRLQVDDYLEKPLMPADLKRAIGETVARRIAQRDNPLKSPNLQIGPLCIHQREKIAEWYHDVLPLTPTEFCILNTLAERLDTVVPAADLIESCRGYRLSNEEAIYLLKPHISNLRHKLEEGGKPRLIHNRRGVGFLLKLPGSFDEKSEMDKAPLKRDSSIYYFP